MIVLERLQRLETTVRELQRFAQTYSLADVRQNTHLEWALRYGFLEAIQMVIDISCQIVSRHNLGVPTTYAECIDLLHRVGYVDHHLVDTLRGMVGLRNILVHEYISFNLEQLYELLHRVSNFQQFAEQIKNQG